jgi:uncharacterized repeat protein (TIGR03803 family)
VFEITGKGILTTLYSFDGTHGAGSGAALVQGTDGDFYGTAIRGGAHMEGTVFKITTKGKLTVLHSFNVGLGGEDPEAGLVFGTDGNLYGTAYQGGQNNDGTIYRVTLERKYSVIHHFSGSSGCCPLVTLMQHTTGLLYGDTYGGGTHGLGVFYSMDVGLQPFVNLVTATGKVGKTIEVLGQGFRGTTGVAFSGTAASFNIKSNTYLTAIVPPGATTGFVTVTTPGGTLMSNKQFTVAP